jgi:PAS domain S-box-containing protein
MAEQLRGSYEQLEQRVVERTEELAASELRYRALFEESRDAIFVSSPDGKVVAANQAALELFEFSLEEAIGSDIGDRFVDAVNRERFRQDIAQTGSVKDFELKLYKKDGTQIDCLLTATRRLDEGAQYAGVQGVIRDITESKLAEEAAHQQTREVAVLEERNRMAREIHDTMAQGFTGIVLQMEAAEQSMETSPGALPEHLNRARALARRGLQEARRSVWGLMPQALEQSTLDTALRNEVQKFGTEGRAKITFTESGKRRDLPPDVQTVLLRICQESLTNIRRHAEASQVDVILDYHNHEVLLSVQDNGAGFDLATVEEEKRGGSFGLIGMRQRAEQIKGQLIVDSAKNQGTLVQLTIPTP